MKRPSSPSSALQPSTSDQDNLCLWTEKHRPSTVADLEVAIHKQKVTEVRDWLSTQHTIGNRVLFLIGPPGCGKSTLLAVLCEKELGFRTIEWIPQPLLSFSEVTSLNNGSVDFIDHVEYRSKLDAFEDFVRSLVAPPLPLRTSWITAEGQSSSRCDCRPAVAILDDLPLTYGHEQLSRMRRILASLINTAAVPTVVLLTPDQHDSIGTLKGCTLIKCNPITELKIIKVLQRILAKEGLGLDEESLMVLAKQANGDLGNAISTLQFYASTNRSMIDRQNGLHVDAQRSKTTNKRGAKRARRSSKDGNPNRPSILRRDLLLTTFHGLGKFLYNKRLWGQKSITESSHLAWAPWTLRPPMDGFTPENVLDAAGLDSNAVSAFLHANLPFFIDDDAIIDMAGCLAQLSASDSLVSAIGGRGGRRSNFQYANDDSGEVPPLAEACSAITAARGICFWNSHPASRSFRQLLRPSVFEARRGMVKNLGMLRKQMRMVRVCEGGAETMESLTVLSTEFLPFHAQWCSMPVDPCRRGRELYRQLYRQKPAVWWRWWDGEVHEVRDRQRGDNDQGTFEIDAPLRDGACMDEDPIEEV